MNKVLVLNILLLIASVSNAQNNVGMSEADMQKMMQHAQQMQTCMANIDQHELSALEKQGRAFESEVNQLCSSGQRDKAQSKAIAFGIEMSTSSSMVAMRKCSELMPVGMLPTIPYSGFADEHKTQHVCD